MRESALAALLALFAFTGVLLNAESISLRPATLAEYTQQIGRLQAMAAACAQKADACAVPAGTDDQTVKLGDGHSFNARYEWFSATLASSRKLDRSQRAAQMKAVAQRLQADLTDATTPPAPAVNFAVARRQADAVLSQAQFRQAVQSSLWDRGLEWLGEWIGRGLAHVAAFGSRSRWMGPLLEWGLAGLAGLLLLLWMRRMMRMQQLALRLEGEGRLDAAEERIRNWLREAEQHAGRGAFREAVHCLYWASIIALEGRRLWQPDRARTPREYLRLLDPSSAAAALLRRQTRNFETIWYGLRPAGQADYEQALMLHRELRSA